MEQRAAHRRAAGHRLRVDRRDARDRRGRGRPRRPAPRRAAALRLATGARARRSGRASTRRAATSSSGADTDIAGLAPAVPLRHARAAAARAAHRYVKAYYQRPIVEGGVLKEGGGGRVTELVARPLINLFFPELSGIIQPLVGRVRRPPDAPRADPVLHRLRGRDRPPHRHRRAARARRASARSTWSVRVHRNQELEGLSQMSFVILQAVMKRLEERRKARLFAELGSTMKLPRSAHGPAVARGHRARRPGAAADDPHPRVPRAAARAGERRSG